MTDQQTPSPPDPVVTQEALRNTASAIALYADGNREGARDLIQEADVFVSRMQLVEFVVDYMRKANLDPYSAVRGLILQAEDRRMTLEQEQDDDDD